MATDREQFAAMLDRAGIGYGTRDDQYVNPDYATPGLAVMVEDPDAESENDCPMTNFHFDMAGRLVSVSFPKD